MKRKLDFVTNSSSTSFCGWGLELDMQMSEMSEEILKAMYDKYIDEHRKYGEGIPASYKEFIEDPSEVYEDCYYGLTEFFEGNGLSCVNLPYECDGLMYVGLEFLSIPEDMTIKEAKEEAKEKLEKLGFDTKGFKEIDEAWRDG